VRVLTATLTIWQPAAHSSIKNRNETRRVKEKKPALVAKAG